MEADDEDDLKLVRASASLLTDLESSLPKLLWKKPTTPASRHGAVHRRVRRKQLKNVVDLIEPFQGEPQLLDARLKTIVPDIVEAFLLSLSRPQSPPSEHVDLQIAACQLLYTLCKVRGYKIIVGFLSNEPRYLEPILEAVERTLEQDATTAAEWQLHYVLLLWLGHLLLTPFDLETISTTPPKLISSRVLNIPHDLPPVVLRILDVGLHYLPASTKAQDAAAALLTRLVGRPDMRKLRLADGLVDHQIPLLTTITTDSSVSVYQRLGALRFLAGISLSAELSHLIPTIYRSSYKLVETDEADAVAKKILVKTFRNVAILSLRTQQTEGPLLSFLQTTSVLEDVIDFLLRSLGDRDTPVRYAAAKAISLVVQELDAEMGPEVIQAVLDTFKEDMPRKGDAMDFSTVNALKWHGLTLTLGHALFKRTASPAQLPDILNALFSALQFEQRAATGSSIGTNVRDAANFGIWSLSRRYTTAELGEVDTLTLRFGVEGIQNVITVLAVQLILASCLDPAGNVRRGSSAALQELVGRHPDVVPEGIALVQIVDYQAVGLRKRAMVEVADKTASRYPAYSTALLDALFGWRGIGSPDVISREAAANAIATLASSQQSNLHEKTLHLVLARCRAISESNAEMLHGLVTSLACLLDTRPTSTSMTTVEAAAYTQVFEKLVVATPDVSARVLRSELSSATAAAIAAISRHYGHSASTNAQLWRAFDTLTQQILSRHEPTILAAVPDLIRSLAYAQKGRSVPLVAIDMTHLQKKVQADDARTVSHGAGRALALGVMAPHQSNSLVGDQAKTSIQALASLIDSRNVDWRVFGLRGIQLAIEGSSNSAADPVNVAAICNALARGMYDYSIDERGDIGSLVRLQAISCASSLFSKKLTTQDNDTLEDPVRYGIVRLSLEKLDRVRHQAALCRRKFLDLQVEVTDVGSVSDYSYFAHALIPLEENAQDLTRIASVCEGCISCSGAGAELLIQHSRQALADKLASASSQHLSLLLASFIAVMKKLLDENSNLHPALELLSFFLDMQIPQRLAESDLKWRTLLSVVQKSHHKSNDIPKILAAVHVYQGLADIPKIRAEVMKKLISMLKTNPYPRVRASIAEVLWILVGDEGLKSKDWSQSTSANMDVVEALQKQHITV